MVDMKLQGFHVKPPHAKRTGQNVHVNHLGAATMSVFFLIFIAEHTPMQAF